MKMWSIGSNAKGAGYQTRMNAVLRAYVRHKAKIDGND
jgi:hypothetical protein